MQSDSERPFTTEYSDVLQKTPSLKDDLKSDGDFIDEDEVKPMNDFPISSITVGNT